ncbi:hypothetical protein D3C73_956240 [compost metagenome]
MRFQPLTNSSNNTGIIRFGGMRQITDQVNVVLFFVLGFNGSIKPHTALRIDNGLFQQRVIPCGKIITHAVVGAFNIGVLGFGEVQRFNNLRQ